MLSAAEIPVQGQLPTPQNAAEKVPGLSAISTIQSLSDLNVELYTHAVTVPNPPKSLVEPLSWKDKDFAIDRTFQLSQRFIDILNTHYPRYLQSAALSATNTPASSAPSNSHHSGSNSDRPPLSIDQASFLLILSCYLRLIDTYDNIFGNMQACLDRASVTAREDYVSLPNVKFGSFSLPNSSALQITLILQLARHLLNRMGEIIGSIELSESSSTVTSDIIDNNEALSPGLEHSMSPTLKALNHREKALIKRVNTLRNTLIDLNIL